MRTRPSLALAGAAALALPLLAGPAAAGPLDDVTGTLDGLTATVDAEVANLTGTATVLVHVADGTDLDDAVVTAEQLGLVTSSRYPQIGVFVATGTQAQRDDLAASGVADRLEHDAPIEALTDTSHTATRGQEVLDGAVTMPDGTTIDGSGVGVAVVDSGTDGTHPDLADRVGSNVKVLAGGIAVPAPDTDTISLGGHGTHVSGIVAGDGTASDGTFHGAAPGATVHGVSAGTLISLHSAMDGLQWVLDNHDTVTPTIRVVNNSWGSSAGDYDPDDAIQQLMEALVDSGVVVVFAAGNAGGDGSAQATSPTCVNPTPGVVCVAAYDDLGTGTRNGTTADFSSRGADGQVTTYPDLAAPGADITATCTPTKPICATGSTSADDPLNYAVLSGTSMAAPHIAGISAQVLQADPSLTPAQVEDVLEDTATDYGDGAPYEADPSNPDSDTSFDKGHGLVDVVAAVTEALG